MLSYMYVCVALHAVTFVSAGWILYWPNITMVRNGRPFNSPLATIGNARILPIRKLKFVILAILIMIFGYLMSLGCPSCQSLTTQRSGNYHKKIQPLKQVPDTRHGIQARRQSVMPAMVEHPGVHVVTSGSDDLETGETVLVYFIWCGERVFRFRNYVSVLSAIYVIKPSKIVFLHTHDMVMDESRYNTWFQMLMETVPMLVIRNIGSEHDCNNIDISNTILKQFVNNDESSIFIGTNTVMAEFPLHLRKSNFTLGSARTGDHDGFLYVRRQQLQKDVVKPDVTKCVSKKVFDPQKGHICIVLDSDLVPKDIWTLDSPFGAFARNLVYGYPKLIQPNQEFSNLAPRIAHYFSFGTPGFHYGNYLSVLSALYVAGLQRVYFHGVKPQSPLFEKLLREENVTHIYMPEYKYIHNHRLKYLTFNVDIGKLYILSKYGGVGQDADIFWTRRIDDKLLAYDAVVGFDWPAHGEYPEVFNLGVLIGKQNAFYFQALLNAMRDYRDDTTFHMAMRLPYRTYELYPFSVYASRRLQVICYAGPCHPAWLPNYIQPLSQDPKSGNDFSWETDVYSVHCTWPKPPAEMVDLETLLKAEGRFAEIGRNILKKAGKL